MRAQPTPPDEQRLLEELRDLIAPERRRYISLERELVDPARVVERGSEYLPRVVKAATEKDDRLAWALQPTLETAIRRTVRERRTEFAEAIYPIIGPSISRAIKSAIAEMLQKINEALASRLSIQSLRWRLEAARTGVSFAEVVLLRTLVYRVEQVLLVERRGGILLASVASEGVKAREPAIVSSLLTALNAFSAEAFGARQGLERIQVGELSVWVESGAHVLLAAVVHGNPPAMLGERLDEVLGRIELQFADALERFSGDLRPFEGTIPLLTECLVEERRKPSRARGKWIGAAMLALVSLLAAALISLHYVREARFERQVAALRSEPGLVIVSANRDQRPARVHGLKDPLAREPAQVLGERGFDPARIHTHFAPYQSLDPVILERRARAAAGRVDAHRQAFSRGRAWVAPAFGREALADVQAFLTAADEAGLEARVDVVGSADSEGTSARNAELAQVRAERARDALMMLGVPERRLHARPDVGAGTREAWLEATLLGRSP